MIAQTIFSLLLCSVLIYAWAQYRRSPAVAMMSLVASLVGLYFVWIPSHTTRVAEFVGIGRGADLIMYLWICISLIVLLNLHLKLRSQHDVITALARAVALANADAAIEAARLRSTEHEAAKPAIPLARDASYNGAQQKGPTSDGTVMQCRKPPMLAAIVAGDKAKRLISR